MAAARSSPRRAAMVVEEDEVEGEVQEVQEGDFTVEVVQAATGEEGQEEEGVVLTELKVKLNILVFKWKHSVCYYAKHLPVIYMCDCNLDLFRMQTLRQRCKSLKRLGIS